jgi:hypothetical protein
VQSRINPFFTKRKKEQAKLEKQRRKEERKAQRDRDKEGRGSEDPQEDPDIAGIVPGPQPPAEDV